MTAGELLAIVEPLPDDWLVCWGCVDHTIPKKLYSTPKTNMGMFKNWLTSEEPYVTPQEVWNGKPVVVRQWLLGKKSITFYLGYQDEA